MAQVRLLYRQQKVEMRIYIGNIDYTVRDEQLELLVSQYDDIISCKIVRDQETGQSQGVAFVDSLTDEGGQAIITELHDYDLAGRKLKVHEKGKNTQH